MFEISKFKEEDKQQWIKLWIAYEEGHRNKEESRAICDQNWPRILNDDRCHSFALREKKTGLAVGFVLFATYWCAFSDKDDCYISGLSVLPKYRNKGGGKMLMQHIIDLATNRTYERVLWLTNKDHPEAISIYDQMVKGEEWIRYKVKTS